MNRHRVFPLRPAHRQQGAALLVLLTLVILVASYALLRQLNRPKQELLRGTDNAAVLAEARDALVGYALSSTVRPGELPCPDYGAGPAGLDGKSDSCDEHGTYVTIGRLPWKTLGLRDLRDASSESLWYAPAIEFDGSTVINSDTQSHSLRVAGNNTRQIVAVVIAPEAIIASQSRPSGAARTTSGRYLESTNAMAGATISIQELFTSTTFNDQVQVITRDELMPAVERRVLGELKKVLLNTPSLPPPARNGTTTCYRPATVSQDSSSDHKDSKQEENNNKESSDGEKEKAKRHDKQDSPHEATQSEPEDASNGAAAADKQGLLPITPNSDCGILPAWPAWFLNNHWQPLIWYAMDPAKNITVQNGTATDTGREALLVAMGPEISSFQNRGASTPPALDTLLEQTNNNSDLVFAKFAISPVTNDQLLVIR